MKILKTLTLVAILVTAAHAQVPQPKGATPEMVEYSVLGTTDLDLQAGFLVIYLGIVIFIPVNYSSF